MATAASVRAKIQNLIATANEATGNADTDLTTAVDALIAGFGTGGDGGGGAAKVTEYVITENADRSLWWNEQQIKLVKGLNILTTSKLDYASAATYKGGAVTFILMLWDGVPIANANNATAVNCHLRGAGVAQSDWNFFAGFSHIVSGNTTRYTIAEDGTLTFTTSATGVTTGNYNNSFIEGGYTYRLLQVESEVVC